MNMRTVTRATTIIITNTHMGKIAITITTTVTPILKIVITRIIPMVATATTITLILMITKRPPTAMYFTIGVAITAVFKAYVTEDLILLFNQSEATGIGLMMVLAFVLSLCSTSDAFIAANFPVPQSAKLAFLIFGPMMDVKLVFMYLSVFKSKFVIILATTLFFVIGILSYLWIRL